VLLLVALDQRGRHVHVGVEAEVPRTAPGDVHGPFEAKSRQKRLEQNEAAHLAGVVGRPRVADPPGDVVSSQVDRRVQPQLIEKRAQVLHDVSGAVPIVRLARGAGAAHVHREGRVPRFRERRHHFVVGKPRLRVAVQKHHDRPRPADHVVLADAVGLRRSVAEGIEKSRAVERRVAVDVERLNRIGLADGAFPRRTALPVLRAGRRGSKEQEG
jgi:hypothetical protein